MDKKDLGLTPVFISTTAGQNQFFHSNQHLNYIIPDSSQCLNHHWFSVWHSKQHGISSAIFLQQLNK